MVVFPRTGIAALHLRFRDAVLAARGGDGIAQEAGDGHRADATGDRGYGARDALGALEIHIADQPGATLGFPDAVDADVNDHGAGLDPVAQDHFRAPDRRDNDIRLADLAGQLSRRSSWNIGLPTMLERPTTMAFLPDNEPPK